MSALGTLVVISGLLNLAFAGFFYAHSNKKAIVTFYALISVFASLWSLSTLFTVAGLPFEYLTYAIYGHYIFGFLAYLSFFWFALYFPVRPKRTVIPEFLITLAALVFLACIPLTSFMFTALNPGTSLADIIVFNQNGYIAFILTLTFVFFAGLILLLVRLRKTSPDGNYNGLTHGQIYFAILSNLVAGVLGITLNLLLPLYGNFSFFYINPIFVTFALIGIGFYNLLKHRLFNAKLVLTEFFTAAVWIISFVRIISSQNQNDFLVNGIILIAWIFFGIFLIRSVQREIRAREDVERLAKQLEQTNERQETLIHFIGHEVKGFLTKDMGAFASLSEGDFGSLSEAAKGFVDHALIESRRGADSVESILKASNLKKGTVTYTKEPFDLKALTAVAVEKSRMMAEQKGLTLSFTADESSYQMMGDKVQINDHVLRNLIDNSINYTPSGSVAVSLKKEGNKLVLAVKDTGIGVTEEDKRRLFTEGGHGKDSQKVNAHSTGYGLFIAKQITEAHSGTIRVESEGEGKGSTFIVELPAKSA